MPHYAFLIVSLTLALTGGFVLGGWMVLGLGGWLSLAQWPALLAAHGLVQVHGFLVLFTLGVSLMVLPRFLGVPLAAPRLAHLSLVSLAAGLGCALAGAPAWLSRGLEVLGVLIFLVVLRKTRPATSSGEPVNRLHGAYLGLGSLWLMAGFAAANHDVILWGFAGLYIAGIGLRMHPRILGVELGSLAPLRWSLLAWNAGLVALIAGWTAPAGFLLTAGAWLYLAGLAPWRRRRLPSPAPDWLRVFVKVSYAWLFLAGPALVCATLHGENLMTQGAARHVLASGFILTMMIGMGLKMIPSFELKDLVWEGAPVTAFWLLTLGNLVRLPAQAAGLGMLVGVGGALQALSVLVFVVVLGATLLRRVQPETTSCQPVPRWAQTA